MRVIKQKSSKLKNIRRQTIECPINGLLISRSRSRKIKKNVGMLVISI